MSFWDWLIAFLFDKIILSFKKAIIEFFSWSTYQQASFVIIFFTFLIAITAGVRNLIRSLRIRRMRLDYRILVNPASTKDSWRKKSAPLPQKSYQLIYFKIWNESKISLLNNTIRIDFIGDFEILEDKKIVNLVRRKIISNKNLGILHEDDSVLLDKKNFPIYNNLIYGQGKTPNLLKQNCAIYRSLSGNFTSIPLNGSVNFPLWVRTPLEKKDYKVQITVIPANIDKEFVGELFLVIA